MERSISTLELARSECASHGLRLTDKRVNLFSLLLKQNTPISAYELADLYKSTFGQSVPIITVYRVLKSLQDKGVVHKLDTINRFIACQHIDCNQEHPTCQYLICSECNCVEEMNLSQSAIDELQQNIEKAGFHLNDLQLEVSCICDSCVEDVD